jgi:hypothetical protein
MTYGRSPAFFATPPASGGGVTTHSALTNPGMTTGDDHTQYQLRAEKGVANGYASLDSGVLIPIAQIPTISHASLSNLLVGNPHTQYALASALASYQPLADKDVNSGYAGLDAAGDIAVGALPKVINFQTLAVAIGASQNDYAPAGITTATVLVLGATAAVTITGFAAGQAEGRVLIVQNTTATAANTVTLAHSSASSLAANRIACPASASQVIRANSAVMLVYSTGTGGTAFWRVIVP